MTAIGQELYDQLGVHKDRDAGVSGQPLRVLSEGCILTLQPVEDVIRDTDTHVGWGKITDPDEAPVEWLPWLAQWGGGQLPEGLTEQEQRDHIKDAPAFRRGGPKAMLTAIKPTLTGTQTVYVVERASGLAYQLQIATLTSETPNVVATKNAILSQKPGGLVLTYFTVDGGDYAQVLASHTNYADILSTYATYADILLDPDA